MKIFEWIVDAITGDHILVIEGARVSRIKAGEDIKFDEGRPGAALATLDELKATLEAEFNLLEQP